MHPAADLGRRQEQPRFGGGPAVEELPLAVDRVRYMGEPIVAILAETEAAAIEAAAAVRLDLEELPAVFDMEEALAPGAVYTNTQAIYFSLDNTSIILQLQANRLRFIGGMVGGGFGGKVDVIVEPLATLGAMKTGRPTGMWISFAVTTGAPDAV